MVRYSLALAGALALLLGACAELQLATHATKELQKSPPDSRDRSIGDYKVGKPYQVAGVWYYPKVDYRYAETGIASWYGPGFDGKKTANGETYDQMDLTAAHRTLPMPSMVRVTNLENGRAIAVRINDRGPFKSGRIIDLSLRASQLLGFVDKGTAKVRVEIMPAESRQLAAVARRREAAANAPLAAPVVEVTEVPLDELAAVQASNTGQTEPAPVGALESAVPALTSPFGSAAAAIVGPGTTLEPAAARPGLPSDLEPASWMIEREDGGVDRLPQVAALPAEENGVADPAVPAASIDDPGTISTARNTARAIETPWPDGTVSVEPVRDTNIFVQAGSFLHMTNASRLSARLGVLGPSEVSPAQVGRRMFYRVRLGPVDSVDEADRLLNVLLSNGISDARVVVD
jgi:rare lipoprotein A